MNGLKTQQCLYHIYVLNFEARAILAGSRTCIKFVGLSTFSMKKQRQHLQTILSFIATVEKSQRQTGNKQVNKYYVLFQFSKRR